MKKKKKKLKHIFFDIICRHFQSNFIFEIGHDTSPSHLLKTTI